MGEACGTYGRQERCIQSFGWGDLMVSDHMEEVDVDGRIKLKWVCKRWKGEAWSGSSWLRIGLGGGRLRML